MMMTLLYRFLSRIRGGATLPRSNLKSVPGAAVCPSPGLRFRVWSDPKGAIIGYYKYLGKFVVYHIDQLIERFSGD